MVIVLQKASDDLDFEFCSLAKLSKDLDELSVGAGPVAKDVHGREGVVA